MNKRTSERSEIHPVIVIKLRPNRGSPFFGVSARDLTPEQRKELFRSVVYRAKWRAYANT